MKQEEVSNWGHYPKIEAEVENSRDFETLKKFLSESEYVIARGNGRCYGDSSLGARIYSTKKWNFFLDFDEQNGILHCESGVLLSHILEMAVPKGYFLPVTPGTKYITVGGAIASDVHGKNHHQVGCFSNFVLEFDLLNGEGEIVTCSRTENSDLFWASIGGMGLTGIILSAKFSLLKIETAYIRSENIQCKNLDEVFQAIDDSESWTYTVAWIDCFQSGKHLGKGILMRGEHAQLAELPLKYRDQPLKMEEGKKLNVPFYFPKYALNKWSMQLFNFLFYHKQLKKEVKKWESINPFFYPLDSISSWNKIYGQSGFIQYQFVIPKERGKEGMRKILETISKSGNGSFLVVLKLFGPKNPKAYNSFPEEGYTLALDFQLNDTIHELVGSLDALVEEYGGRIYRTKDAMSKSSLTDYLKNIDHKKFDSAQNIRIKQGEQKL